MLRAEPVTLTTELPGRVSALEASDVRPQINGVVRRRDFTEGSIVQAGQVLYEIEDSPYRAAVLSAQGQLAQAEANIRSTQLQADRYPPAGRAQRRQQAGRRQRRRRGGTGQGRRGVRSRRAEGRRGQPRLHPHPRADLRPDRPLAVHARARSSRPGRPTRWRPFSGWTRSMSTSPSRRPNCSICARDRSGELRRRTAVQLVLPNGAVYPIDGVLRFADVTVDPDHRRGGRARHLRQSGRRAAAGPLRPRPPDRRRAPQGLLAPQAGVTRNERGQAVALVVGPGDVVVQRMVDDRRGDRRQVAGQRAGCRPATG